MHKTPRRNPKTQKTPSHTFIITGTDKPCAHVGKQHATPALNKGQEATCCLTQRNVMLIRSCSRPGLCCCYCVPAAWGTGFARIVAVKCTSMSSSPALAVFCPRRAFSCISFKYVSLLALVSEFNCFLRSRCSMEMWCPDDIGLDSWDWVGPPAWERACFNSPEWGGGSSHVKTEPHQIVVVVVVFDAD